VAPRVISRVKVQTDSYTGGFLFLAAALVLGGLLALAARHDPARERAGVACSPQSPDSTPPADPA
jgi:hypothetical protein